MSPSRASGLRRGRPGRPATGGMPSTRARVWVTSLTLAAVVMTLSGVPRPSQIRWCLLPVFRRSTGDGPVSDPPFSRGCGNHPRRPVTSRVRRRRSALRAEPGAAGRRLLLSATGPDDASRSAPNRTVAPGAEVARPCRCGGRTGCPAGRADPTPAAAPETAPATEAATARSTPTTHRPRSMVECSRHLERPNRHIGHARPGHLNKILLRALSRKSGRGRRSVQPWPPRARVRQASARRGSYGVLVRRPDMKERKSPTKVLRP